MKRFLGSPIQAAMLRAGEPDVGDDAAQRLPPEVQHRATGTCRSAVVQLRIADGRTDQ